MCGPSTRYAPPAPKPADTVTRVGTPAKRKLSPKVNNIRWYLTDDSFTLRELSGMFDISEKSAGARVREIRAAGYNVVAEKFEGVWLYTIEA